MVSCCIPVHLFGSNRATAVKPINAQLTIQGHNCIVLVYTLVCMVFCGLYGVYFE